MKKLSVIALLLGLFAGGCYTPESRVSREEDGGQDAVVHGPAGIESRSRESFGSFSNPASVSDPRAANTEIIAPGKTKASE